MIVVKRGGLHCSIQDLGRFGFRHLGVPISGVMDEKSARLANLLLDNAENDAVLEMGLIGPDLFFKMDTWLVVTGAPKKIRLNSSALKLNTLIPIKEGDVLSVKSSSEGVWTYLGIKGGFLTESHFQSRSSYPPAQLGSPYLMKGTTLSALSFTTSLYRNTGSRVKISKAKFNNNEIRVLRGPEFDSLNRNQQLQLFNKAFKIGSNSSRMAYYLGNNNLEIDNLKDIITVPVAPGTVQLLPSGILMLLMKDAQSTGGYPRILQVLKKDLDRVAQIRVNEEVNFRLQSN